MRRILQSPLGNVLLYSIFWALEIYITKLAFLNGAEVIPFTIQSIFLTFIFLSLYVLPTKYKNLKRIPLALLLWILLANAIHMGIGTILSNAGIQLTTAINAGFLMQFTTVTIIFFAWLLLHEKITVAKIISVVFILIGTFLLITKGQFSTPHSGDILIILACIAWGLGGVLTRKVLKHGAVDSDIVALLKPVAGIPVILVAIAFSAFYPPAIQQAFQKNIFEFNQAYYVFINAIIITFVWIFYNRMLKIASASYNVIVSSIAPIIVALLALIFLNESLNSMQIIGAFLIVAPSFIAQYLQFDKH
jgi:drug/metabolite transporter (DMT)-like permease